MCANNENNRKVQQLLLFIEECTSGKLSVAGINMWANLLT